jgi:DNA polymerase
VHIDFETAAEGGISGLTTSRYSQICHVLCLAYGDRLWWQGDPPPIDLFDHVAKGGKLYAHHANFERRVWQQLGWPKVADDQWVCSATQCAVMAVPRALDNACEFLALPVSKDSKGKRLMQRITKTLKRPRADELSALGAYCLQDVRAEIALSQALPQLTQQEAAFDRMTTAINDRGIKIDLDLARAAHAMWESIKTTANAELQRLTGCSGRQQAELVRWLNSRGVTIDSLDRATLAKVRSDDSIVQRVIELRQEVAQAAPDKFAAILANVEPDGRVRDLLVHHGAKTGRHVGVIIQPQNLARGCVDPGEMPRVRAAIIRGDRDALEAAYGSPAEVLGSMVRPCLIGDPHLVAADYASIEARALAWAAGESKLVNAFHHGDDVYKLQASMLFHKPVEAVDKRERSIGKECVLGAGYQLGSKRFKESLSEKGIAITADFAKCVIDAYRKSNAAIVKFWADLESAAISAVKGRRSSAGPFEFRREGQWLFLKLPSGRDLAYFKPKIAEGRFGDDCVEYQGYGSNGKAWSVQTYAGIWAENAISGMCRDLLMTAIAKLDRVVLAVHDEIVVEGGSVDEVVDVMVQVPAWAAGLPIKAEGWQSPFYHK